MKTILIFIVAFYGGLVTGARVALLEFDFNAEAGPTPDWHQAQRRGAEALPRVWINGRLGDPSPT